MQSAVCTLKISDSFTVSHISLPCSYISPFPADLTQETELNPQMLNCYLTPDVTRRKQI